MGKKGETKLEKKERKERKHDRVVTTKRDAKEKKGKAVPEDDDKIPGASYTGELNPHTGMVCKRSPNMERVKALARPNARRLRSLWDEQAGCLPKERRDRLKSALEEDYFLSPEQTEQYFQALAEASKRNTYGIGGPMAIAVAGGGVASGAMTRKDMAARQRELQQRQKWLVNFSAQVAYRMCDYISKGQKEMLVSNRLRSIADVVLERVADILGEPKPTRNHPGRLARFMVAISDRIAVWIENAVYHANALDYEPPRESGKDEHIRLDTEEPVIC